MLWSVRVGISVAINVFQSYNQHSLWKRVVIYRMMLHAAEGTGDLQFPLSMGMVITERSASFISQVTLSPEFFPPTWRCYITVCCYLSCIPAFLCNLHSYKVGPATNRILSQTFWSSVWPLSALASPHHIVWGRYCEDMSVSVSVIRGGDIYLVLRQHV